MADETRPTMTGFARRFSFSVDFWWAYLVYLGVLPRGIALAIALALAAAAAGFVRAAWRVTGMYDGRSAPHTSRR